MTLPIVERLRGYFVMHAGKPFFSNQTKVHKAADLAEAADTIEQLYAALLHWQRESQVWADILWFEGREAPGWFELAQGKGDTALAKARGQQ